jgi:molybdopterin molybdotransferase
MISFADAQKIVLSHALELPSEEVPLGEALNRVLAMDVFSDVDMPPFDKAAMDGYACRRADLESELAVTEVIAAGSMPAGKIGPLQCAKIMTGAVVPEGADCVIMVEYTDKLDNGKISYRGKGTDNNICYRGEDVKVNDPALAKGTLIRPQHVAVMAMYGIHSPRVTARPRVGVIATGSELVEVHRKPQGPQIRNSNSPQLSAQAMAMGCRLSITVSPVTVQRLLII